MIQNSKHPLLTDAYCFAIQSKNQALVFVYDQAARIKKFVQEGSGKLLTAPTEAELVVEPEFTLARKYAWALRTYETIFNEEKPLSSPGPGNGYFETIRLLLDQIETLGILYDCGNEFDRVPYHNFLNSYLPGIPEQTEVRFPVFLYFIALRMKRVNELEPPQKLNLDYWLVSVAPSKNTHISAMLLLSACQNMFNLLRYGMKGQFISMYPEFEKQWKEFFDQLRTESKEKNYAWCYPDLEINALTQHLLQCSQYPEMKNAAEIIARSFDENGDGVLESCELYPKSLNENHENNRANQLTKLCLDRASTTLAIDTCDFFHEVKVLELRK